MATSKFTALAASLCVTLAACGGGGSDVTPPLAQPVACTPKVVKIQLFGDSTQWGYLAGGGGVRASVYPELALQQLMDLKFGRGAVVVSTRAVSGTTSSMLLAGTDGLNKPWPQSVDADIAVVNHGVNDANPGYGISAEDYRANLHKLAVAPAQVVFETPLPVSTNPPHYDQVMRDVSAELNVPLIDARAYVLSLPNWWQYATDGVHATSDGYQAVVSGAVYPGLGPMVAKLRCQ